jgi:hypothetical protein
MLYPKSGGLGSAGTIESEHNGYRPRMTPSNHPRLNGRPIVARLARNMRDCIALNL